MARSGAIDKLTRRLRSLAGTPLETPRNALLTALGLVLDGQFRIERALSPEISRPHPLMRLISKQAGNPTEVWNVADLDRFRSKFDELLDYLPRSLPNGVSAVAVAPRESFCIEPTGVLTSDIDIVYLHGGGFVLGDAKSVLPEAAWLSRACNRRVHVYDYLLAPESKYPGALDDLEHWLNNTFALPGRPFVVVGESAGANLVLACLERNALLLELCDRLVLLYPFVDLTLQHSTVELFGRDYFLTRKLLEFFRDQYLSVGADVRDYSISPGLSASLISALPMSLCIVGEFDPLLDDSRRLASDSANMKLIVAPGMYHGFLQMRGILPLRRDYLRRIAEFVSGG